MDFYEHSWQFWWLHSIVSSFSRCFLSFLLNKLFEVSTLISTASKEFHISGMLHLGKLETSFVLKFGMWNSDELRVILFVLCCTVVHLLSKDFGSFSFMKSNIICNLLYLTKVSIGIMFNFLNKGTVWAL